MLQWNSSRCTEVKTSPDEALTESTKGEAVPAKIDLQVVLLITRDNWLLLDRRPKIEAMLTVTANENTNTNRFYCFLHVGSCVPS